MSYIPNRAMHHATPHAAADAAPAKVPANSAPDGSVITWLSERVSPQALTAVAVVAGVVATGAVAAIVADAVVRD